MGILRYIQVNYRGIFRGFYFLIALIIVLICLPREGRFKYEFQKGKPWMHNDLYAPFDFPIYKTDAEIFSERSHILRDFKPFFRYDSLVMGNSVNQFRNDFRESWSGYSSGSKVDARLRIQQNLLMDKLEAEVIAVIEDIYSKGIVDQSESISNINKSEVGILVLRNNISYESHYDKVFTKRKAIDFVNGKIHEYTPGNTLLTAFWNQFNLQ
ncbi:MAG: hypothetical protein AB7S54_10535 [Bacteroidales bacterium]